jgi:TolB-like protein
VTKASNAVFLSYASEDAEAAQRICDTLRAAGIEVWFDRSELRGGDAWDHRIREQIHDCRLFIPIISSNSEARDEGYFRREWRLAADRTHDMSEKKAFVLPVVIDGTRERGAAVPDRFHDVQWTRLTAGETTAAFVAHVAGLMAQAPAAAGPGDVQASVTGGAQPAQSRSRWRTAVAITAAIALVLALSFVGLERFVLSNRSTAPAVGATEKSVAVLPFVDLSEKHDQEYFADGMAEETLNQLAKIPGLKVIGRTSSFQYKGKAEDLRKIGTTLGAAHILEGSVRRSGDRLRVTAQLIDTRDGAHRWSETYEGNTTDVLRLQGEIALRVARALDLELGAEAFPSQTSINSPEAYEYYLRGNRELAENSTNGIDAAREYFQKSLVLDPKFGRAAVGIATTYLFKCADAIQPDVMCPRAHESVESALRLDSRNPDAYAVRAELFTIFDWNWGAAEADIKKAVELGGGQTTKFADARLAYATGKWDRGRELLHGIIAADPLDPNAMIDLASLVEWKTGHYEEAELWMRKGLQIAPNWIGGNVQLGLIQLAQGKLDEALVSMKREKVDEGQLIGLVVVYSAMGRKADSDAALNAMERNESYFPSDLARVHAFRGELDRALSYLEKAHATHDPNLWFIKDDPLVKNLEGDPRYKSFLRKMNLPD